MSKDLEQKQLDLEEWAGNAGTQRALSTGWEKAVAGILAHRHATNYWLAVQDAYRRSKRVPGVSSHIWGAIGSESNAKRVALETLVYVLGNSFLMKAGGASRNKLAAVIGHRAEYVCWLNHPIWGAKVHIKGLRLASNCEIGMKLVMKRLKHKNFRKMEVYKAFSIAERVALGTVLLELMAQSTGLIQIIKERTRKGWAKTVQYTSVFQQVLDQYERAAILFRTVYMPMAVPPRDWNSFVGGGYLTIRTKLSTHDETRYNALTKRMSNEVYDSINYLQSIPFCLDEQQVWVQRRVWELNHEVGDLPRRILMPAPSLNDYLARGLGPTQFWADYWSFKADERKLPERTKFVHALVGHEKLKEFERIYHVWQMDYRGRLYSRGGAINYIKGDLVRSWYEFERSAPVKGNEKSLMWCLGEAYGLQAAETQRESWCSENHSTIRAIAEDPIGNLALWSSAKEPWKLLKLCRDFAHYMDDPSYMTGTVFQADQSTSGYAHLACLLRDEKMAKLSNVIGKHKQDVYETVGEEAIRNLEVMKAAGMHSDGELLKQHVCSIWWLKNKPPRRVWKSCVMPYVYGRKFMSLREGIEAYLKDEVKHHLVEGDLRIYDLANTLAKAVHDAVKTVFPNINVLQSWLRTIGRMQIERNQRPHWRTPNGLFVESYSSVTYTERIQLDVSGRTLHLDVPVADPSGAIDPSSASNLGADFVHSLEAAFLQQFVCLAKARDWPIITVHDCFGTTLDNYAEMRKSLCAEWKRFYQTDWLRETGQGVANQLKVDVPEPDYTGDLRLSRIGQNPYLFG